MAKLSKKAINELAAGALVAVNNFAIGCLYIVEEIKNCEVLLYYYTISRASVTSEPPKKCIVGWRNISFLHKPTKTQLKQRVNFTTVQMAKDLKSKALFGEVKGSRILFTARTITNNNFFDILDDRKWCHPDAENPQINEVLTGLLKKANELKPSWFRDKGSPDKSVAITHGLAFLSIHRNSWSSGGYGYLAIGIGDPIATTSCIGRAGSNVEPKGYPVEISEEVVI